MVATVLIHEKNGAGETDTDKTSGTIRYRSNDSAATDASNPIDIPGAGEQMSYEKWLRLSVTVAPDNNITNVEAYTDGANGMGTGVAAYYRVVGSYATPAEPADNDGLTDLFSATSGSPIDLEVTNTGPFTGTGDIADYLVTTLGVSSTATQGNTGSETLTFAYDES